MSICSNLAIIFYERKTWEIKYILEAQLTWVLPFTTSTSMVQQDANTGVGEYPG